MKKIYQHHIKTPIRMIVYTMLVFVVFRGLFLIEALIMHPDLSFKGWALSFIHGIRLDVSASSYIVALPFLVWLMTGFIHRGWLHLVFHFLFYVFTSVAVLTGFINLIVYHVWGTLFNARALAFATQPKEMLASLTSIQLIIAPLIIIALIVINYKLCRSYCFPENYEHHPKHSILRFLIIACIPIGIRGGLQQIPINESASYYSDEAHLNLAATNPLWYLLNSIYKSGDLKRNEYQFREASEAKKICSQLKSDGGDSLQLFNSPRPNIVMIVLESWTADIIEPLGGDSNITPFFTSLCKEGILFNNIYASGRRTDQMFPSILSGFPAQPNHSIIRYSDKTAKLPFFSQYLGKQGYETAFLYGGELEFANMRSYLLQGGFKTIIGKEAFASADMNSKWGAHDGVVLNKELEVINGLKAPFFSMILTLSTHEPFEVPMKAKIAGKSESDKFRNAAAYTDESLKEFFTKAKQQPWYSNTVFVLVADHGHLLPRNHEYADPACYRIPLLIAGGGINPEFIGTKYEVIGAQNDIPSTLLKQLGMSDTAFIYSNNLLSKTRVNHAYMNFDDGFGYIDNSGSWMYNFTNKKFIPAFSKKGISTSDSSFIKGSSYLQTFYEQFIGL
ncbi:MAG TPA: LTA synthase family protein [Bacteroidia bacterium]|jgi:phosphoglycerol transferase MdoB-like AlkP superfamily enzyme|nr:LTA synthase family protein [Bacteroidia bacterium]